MKGTVKTRANESIKNMSINTYENRTHKGHCIKCGSCCTAFLPLSEEDIIVIKQYLSTHEIKPEHNNNTYDTIDTVCPFLSKEGLCLIYEVRPLICRVFKCNKTGQQVNQRYKKLFMKINVSFRNMWSVFFNDNRANTFWLMAMKERYKGILEDKLCSMAK